MTGYVNPKQYGTVTPWENEIGSVEQVRYLQSTVFAPWTDAGGAAGAMRSTSGTNADVYPVLYLARDAFGIVPLKGKDSLTPMVVNPSPSVSDPLAQRGTIGWKAMTACVILNDAYMARLEVCATA
jgi:N4-gp56 family major capsid protein